jgi:hypothetical protein
MDSHFNQGQREWLDQQDLGHERSHYEHITTWYIVNFKYMLGEQNLLEGTNYSVSAMEAKYNMLMKVSIDIYCYLSFILIS